MTSFGSTIPTAVLTGFLGSGKTTLLNALLRGGALRDAAIIVNEFGEISIDHALIETVRDGIALLNAGCLCCSLRTDLEQTLRDLFMKRLRGLLPEFRSVVIETSGLADPGPVLQALLSRSVREHQYNLASVVTTVDAVNGARSLALRPEAGRQVAVADRLVLTKIDLCEAGAVADLKSRLAAINPFAPILLGGKERIDAQAVLGDTFLSGGCDVSFVERWAHAMDRADRLSSALDHGIGASSGDPGHPEAGHRHELGRHDDRVHAFGYVIKTPLDWDELIGCIKAITERHGDQVLRIKALLDITGIEGPVVLHGVHRTLHPPDILTAWPGAQRDSRIVFIVHDMDRSVIDSALQPLPQFAREPIA